MFVKLTVKMDESMELIGIFPGLQVNPYRKSNAPDSSNCTMRVKDDQ